MATAVSPTGIDSRVAEFLEKPRKMLIDGNWVDAISGKTFPTYNPATGEVLANVAEGDKADIDAAVKAARSAFDSGPWSRMTAAERGKLVWKLADLLEQHIEEFATLETLDNGKPLTVARAADVPLAVDMFRYMAGWATKLEGTTIPLSVPYTPGVNYHAYTVREPVGVVGQIIPWNFPLLMAAWKLAPALACGCTVVLKPAEQTPLSALRLGELIAGSRISRWRSQHRSRLRRNCWRRARRPRSRRQDRLHRIHRSRQADRARRDRQPEEGLARTRGQVAEHRLQRRRSRRRDRRRCERYLLQSRTVLLRRIPSLRRASVFDQVVEGVANKAKKIKVGSGLDPSTHMGPLVSEEQLQRVCNYLEIGMAEGAKAASGGHKIGDKGYFVEPTVLVDTTEYMKVVQEEIFGPVVAAIPFDDPEELVRAPTIPSTV